MSHNPRLTRKTSSILTQETKTGTLTPTTYSYDRSKNLTSIVKPSGKTITNTYNNGNRALATANGTNITASYTLDDNLVTYGQNSYLYDEDGYLKEKTTPQGTTTYTYGTRGELKEVLTPTKTITYKQNALNQRVAKLVDGQVVEKYLWANLTTLLAVYDSSDNLLQRFEYADQRMPVAMTKGADKFYLHYDQVGSLRAVTDSSHNIVKEITYDTYGNILTDSNPSFTIPFGFAGGLYDADTKLTRFGYRDYDTYTGKWTAKDPIGFSGGDSNLYGYVLGDPVNLVDPTGEFGVPGAIGGGVVGFGMSFFDPCTGEMHLPDIGDLILNTIAGASGGFLGGYFAGSSTVLGVLGGGIGSGWFSSVVNYSLAPECKEEPICP